MHAVDSARLAGCQGIIFLRSAQISSCLSMAVGLELYKPGARFGLIQADQAFVNGSGRHAEYGAVAIHISTQSMSRPQKNYPLAAFQRRRPALKNR